MCEHPIFIRNTTKRYAEGVTKLGFWVPCGKCESCRRAMREEWFCRAYAEYLDCVEKGGKVYFFTNTYNPKSLPVFNPKTNRLCHGLDRVKDGCIPCFSKADIDRYRNTLNKWFERKGVTGVRYLICCEYGTEENGQHLPHYHGLAYVPENDIPDKEVEDIILDEWKFGYSFYSHKGASVESLDGIGYVTKYCCKQIEYFEREDLKNYISKKSNLEKIKNYLPKHWQSKGFGLYLANWLSAKDNILDYFTRGIGKDFFGVGGEDKFYSLPRYIVNKLLYKVNDKGVRVHSDLGKELAPKLFALSLDKCEKSLKRYFTVNGLRPLIDSQDCHRFISINEFDSTIPNNYAGLSGYLCKKLNNRPIRELALYMLSFRGLTLPERSLYLYNCIEDLNTEELECVAYSILDDAENDDVYYYSDKSFKDSSIYDKCYTWSASPRFDGFETILRVIQDINSLSAKRKTAPKVDDDKVITTLKNLLN